MRKRNRAISIRVSEQEYESIQKKIQLSDQTQQSFIINAIEGATISTEDDTKLLMNINLQMAELIKQIKGIAVNINQMAHKANAYEDIPTLNQLKEYGLQTENMKKEADNIWRLIRQSISQQRRTQP